MPALSALYVYPVKSCSGIPLAESAVEPRGLRYDRRWMLVDAGGRFLTQRALPQMALIDVQVEGERLHFRAPGQSDLLVDTGPTSGRDVAQNVSRRPAPVRARVEVWGDEVEAEIAPDAVNDWFSHYLGLACRLAHMPEDSVRAVDPGYGAPGDEVSFADGYPVLLATEASLADLNGRLAEPVTIRRFRPNLVVRGTKPFEEDGWREIRVGEVRFRVVKGCARCQIVNVDPESGVPSREPLRTLAAYRTRDNKAYFAQNLIPVNRGTVRAGDEVEVLARR